ncbi:MAG: calcium-binding protein [Caulobacter sp.]|nr:calcium-binding protein [Caulobacter sp.]
MIINGTAGPDHLIGGVDDDVINGLGGDDTLEGLGGNDQINGASGNDYLYGGAGADALDGGADFDLARYDGSLAGVTVDLTTGTGVGGEAQGDTLSAIEGLVGSGFNDVLKGNNLGNILYGLGGDDSLYGVSDTDIQVGGPDALNGGDGNDHLFVSLASQIVDGGPGYDMARYDQFTHGVDIATDRLTSIEALLGSNFNDILAGDIGDNVLYGVDGDDTLVGRGGTDHLYGNDGNDVFIGDSSNSLMDGGFGLDMVRYENSQAGVTVDLVLGLGSGGDAQGDTYASVEAVAGSNFADILIGDDDVGGTILYGQGGDDVLKGGGGRDTLYGGAGADRFYLGAGWSNSNIMDFTTGIGHDLIGILMNANGTNIVDYATLLPHIHDVGGGIMIDLGVGSQTGVPGLLLADVTSDLFFFYS